MKVRVLLLVVVALLSLFGASQTLGQEAEDASCEAVYLVDGWARASVEGAPNSAAYDAIDAYVEQQMRRLHPPGVSLAIVAGERMAHGRGYLKLYMPGYFWIVTISGGLATVWSLLRAGSLLRLSRGSFSL